MAPLCAGVHSAAGLTLHSWNPLVTAEWPEAWAVTARLLQNNNNKKKKHNSLCVLQKTLIPGWGRHCMNHFKFPLY